MYQVDGILPASAMLGSSKHHSTRKDPAQEITIGSEVVTCRHGCFSGLPPKTHGIRVLSGTSQFRPLWAIKIAMRTGRLVLLCESILVGSL